ncbi:RidA family protein [Nocardia jejuensis]|uniref:RidA family protein n=1 Tax=Nocardia jejuensis TaxID=328049 RepID=UPI00082A302F|nr:RidA family protein [Nocardia jejuensis]
MPDVRARLVELGVPLPQVNPPKGVYLPAVRTGSVVHIAGQVPMVAGEVVRTGRVGAEVTVEEAAALGRGCVLSALAAVAAVAELDSIVRVVRVAGYVASAPGFDRQFEVVAAANVFLAAVLGPDRGGVCTAVGVPDLPLRVPIELEITVQLAD